MARVVHVISSPGGVGGAERVVAQLVAGGSRRGWEQVVLNPFASSGTTAGLYPTADYRHVPVRGLQDLPRMWRWLRRELRALEPQVVHAHLFHATAAVAAVPRRCEARVATNHHGALLTWQGRRAEARLDRWAGTRYDRVVAVSRSVERHLLDGYGYRPEEVTHIPNGWEGMPRPRSNEERPPTVVCIANFRPEKGHEILLESIGAVRERVPGVRVVLIGSGPLEDEVRSKAAHLGVEDVVDFTGTVDDVWPILARADVLALPSLQEPLGLVVMEAMAAGLPIVASDVGGIPELVEPGMTGRLVPPGDVDALARCLVEVLTEPALAVRMGEAGRRAANALTADVMVDRYLELYALLMRTR